jgi:hypothetical protein
MTWFCKHRRGQVGLAFWQAALKPLVRELESALAYWCLTQLELPAENLAQVLAAPTAPETEEHFTPDMLDETATPEAHHALWGPWAGREAEFYSACGRLVSALSAAEALSIGGPRAALRLRLARQAYAKLMATDLPRAARPERFTVRPLTESHVQVVSYSEYDPLVLSLKVLNLLPYFEGRTLADALQAIRAATGLKMTPALVRKLLDFKILAEAE